MKRKLTAAIFLICTIGSVFGQTTPASANLTATIAPQFPSTISETINNTTLSVGSTFTITAGPESSGGFYDLSFVSDHALYVTVISQSGLTLSPVTGGIYLLYNQTRVYTGFTVPYGVNIVSVEAASNTPGSITFQVNYIIPNSGESADANTPTPGPATTIPVPTSVGAGPTATAVTIVPFGISGPNIYTRTPQPIIYPTAATCGLYNQCNLYSPPSAFSAGPGGLFTFSIGDEVNIANNVIGVYRLANSQGAVNILMILFSVFGGIGLLFMVIKKAGK